MLGEVTVRVSLIFSLTRHLRSTLGAGPVKTTLAGHVGLSMATPGADTIAAWTRAGFIPAAPAAAPSLACAASAALATPLPSALSTASATENLLIHICLQ